MKYPNYLFEYIEDNKRLRAEVSEARADHATAYANTVALAQECVRLRAVLAAVIAICDAQYLPFKADPRWVRDVRAAIERNQP